MTKSRQHDPSQPGPGETRRAPPEGEGASVDRLLECLAALTTLFGDPRTPTALGAGLPLIDNRLTPELFVRAAERVGITAGISRRPLAEIPQMLLPAVLLLNNGSACLLIGRDDDGTLKLLVPGKEEKLLRLEAERLERLYSGRAILVKAPVRQNSDPRQSAAPESVTSWFWGTLVQFWPSYLQVLMAALMVNGFALASPLFVMNVYDRVVPNQAMATLWVLALGMLIVILFEFTLQIIRGYLVDNVGKRADVLVSSRIFAQVVNISLHASPVSTGTFANRLREFETLRDFVSSATVVAVVDLPFLLFFLAATWMIGGPLAFIPALAIPVVIASGLLMQIPQRRAAQKIADDSSTRHGIIIETISALDTVKTLNLEGRMQRRWEQSVSDTARTTLRSRMVGAISMHISKTFMRLVTVAVIIFGVYRITTGDLSMGGLIACTILAGRAMEPLGQIAGLLTRMNQALAALKGLNEIMALPVERSAQKRFLSRPAIRGDIEFRNVTFAFPGSKVPALRNVSFTIRAGERVGIIGPVGSGKTTIGKLLNGLYAPQEGTILIDGTDIRQIDPADLRNAIGFVQQDIVLFQGSVRDNIAIARPESDDEQVLAAARVAGVDAFISRHPLGYDLMVGEKGGMLSGGQRQFIALARAILKNPPIFVMDEPTSMMDPSAQQHFLRHVGPVAARKTLLLVTHKPNLFPLVERLIVLREGQLLMDGPRKEVLRHAEEAPPPRRAGGTRGA